DPAFADAEMRATGTDGMAGGGMAMHPAAEATQGSPEARRAAAAAQPAEPPPGWVQNAALGRWVDPNDPDTWGKVPRNASCPCGSGKKFKQCHGRVN
ncbi:MAG: SEC-C metal-binding domain-containing protein, partial [Rickettsiales bacterium]